MIQFKTKYTQLFSALAVSFIIFFLSRLFLYLSYFDYFSTLTLQETLLSFFTGFRVDMAEIFTFTFILWILHLLPYRFTLNKNYRVFLGSIWGIFIAFITYFNIADTLYFGFVNRHLSNELSVIGNDVGILFDMAINYYPVATVVSSAIFILIVYIFMKIFGADILDKRLKSNYKILFLALIIAFLGIRGKVTGISFGISDAFSTPKLASGNLALNGFFCFYRSGKSSSINHSKIKVDDAVAFIKDNLSSSNLCYVDNNYPLLKAFQDNKKTNYNVVIVLIESLSAKYLDSLMHNNLGVTPNLDKLADSGILFTNFYANGQRSIEGITSIFTSIVQPVGLEPFGEGLELYNPSYIAKIANENGYTTLSMQSSPRGSYKVDALSALAGFKYYYGSEDIPHVGDEISKPYFGAWDGDMFKFLASKLHTLKEPFLAFTFTASTHAPYHLPGKKWQKYEHSTKTENGFLNTLNYVDSQIGEFINRVKNEKFFDRTIFIFTADHANKAKIVKKDNLSSNEKFLASFHIPLIIYAPKIFKAKRVSTLGSHIDIFPTILDMLNITTPFSSVANSLFDNGVKNRVVFVKKGDSIGVTDLKGSVFYNFNQFLDDKNSTNMLKKELLSIDSAQANLLKSGKWNR